MYKSLVEEDKEHAVSAASELYISWNATMSWHMSVTFPIQFYTKFLNVSVSLLCPIYTSCKAEILSRMLQL